MTDNDPTDPNSADADDAHQDTARKNRGVRFSNSEWEEVKQAAQTRGVTPAEFVRERILEFVRNPAAGDSVPIPADLVPLIERTFRYTYILATRMRDDMADQGKAEELDRLASEARALQDDLRAAGTD